MNEQDRPSLREALLEKIKRGEVTMRPKWQFVLKGALLVLGAVLLSLALLYVVSFVFFTLRHTGIWFVTSFGWRGLRAFFVGIPWLLVLIAAVFIIVLEVLVRRYAFAYRTPLLYSVLGIVSLVFIGGFAVAHTTLHRGLFRRAQEGLPVAGPLYRTYGMPHFREVHPGIISSTTDQGFILLGRQGESVMVIMTPKTRLPFGFDFTEGDQVVVFGMRDADDVVYAMGVREVDEDFVEGIPQRGMRRMMPPPWFPPQAP